jgi:hypothetical protein
VTSADREGGGDLSAFLADGRRRAEQLADGYFTATSFRKRGGYLELLVNESASLLATREQILRPLLRELDGGKVHLDHFDEARDRRTALLTRLDELSIGVGPADVHQHRPEEAVGLVRDLRDELKAYDQYEANELMPFVEARLDRRRLVELGERARKVSKRSPTHAHPDRRPADQRSLLGNVALAAYDRLRDVPSHPRQALETGGEEGP